MSPTTDKGLQSYQHPSEWVLKRMESDGLQWLDKAEIQEMGIAFEKWFAEQQIIKAKRLKQENEDDEKKILEEAKELEKRKLLKNAGE